MTSSDEPEFLIVDEEQPIEAEQPIAAEETVPPDSPADTEQPIESTEVVATEQPAMKAEAVEVVPLRAEKNKGVSAKGGSIVPGSKGFVQEGAEGEGGGKTSGGRMGERLVEMGVITTDQLNVALQEKKVTGRLFGETLVDLGFIDENTLTIFLAKSSGFGLFDPKRTIIDGEALALIEKPTAVKYQILPVSLGKYEALVAMSDPYDVMAKNISNYFYRFLARKRKLGLMKIKLYDLKKFQPALTEVGNDLSDILDGAEID